MKSSHFIKAKAFIALTYVSTSLSAQTVIGSGTANKVPKFTITGSTIGDSQILDNGTTVSIATPSLIIGGTTMATGDHLTVLKNHNAKTQIGLRNGTTGSAASSSFFAWSVGAYMTMSSQALGYSSSSMFEAQGSTIQAYGLNGLNIGTISNAQLSFWTNNTKKMTITSTGSVGIGTATPDKLLTVSSAVANTQIAKFADDARYIGLGRDEVAAFTLAGGVADMFLGNNGTNTYIRGNVGIGAVPREHFQIGDRFVFHDGGYKYLGYNVFFAGSQNERIIANEASSLIGFGSGDINFETASAGPTGVSVNSTSKLFIKNNGLIGIGTNNPTKTLTVMGDASITTSEVNAFDIIDPATSVVNFRVKTSGVVYAREVNVQLTGFPDYVFNKDYKLTPLNEVEAYINANKHLKGFEAAAEYESNGMNMGEVIKLQQEKIEELTLYLIEQQKQMEELKQEMKSLKK